MRSRTALSMKGVPLLFTECTFKSVSEKNRIYILPNPQWLEQTTQSNALRHSHYINVLVPHIAMNC